jgi:hypothetical protein
MRKAIGTCCDAEDKMMLTDIGQHLLYLSAAELRQYLYRRRPGEPFAETYLPWSVGKKDIAKNNAKSIPFFGP